MSKLFVEIKKQTIEKQEIIQQNLLDPNGFAKYCHDRGLSILSAKNIKALWQLGLIQADLIFSDKNVNIDGLILMEGNHSREGFEYVDNRTVPVKECWAGSFLEELDSTNTIHLYFHPFRFYSLYHIERVFTYNLSSLQYLMNGDGAKTIIDLYNEKLLPSHSGSGFSKKISTLNDIIALVVFSEPFAYQKIFSSMRWSPPDTRDSVRRKIEYRQKLIRKVFQDLNLDKVEEYRSELCIDTELLDSNKILHMILRMMNAKMRQELKGKLGGAMLLFSMAENLRLSAEYAFDEKLPEEDELGFGVWMKDVKRDIFGANRLYDAKDTVKQEFFRQYGADHGTRVRCYLEGETEYGAFASLLGISNKIDLINLKGRVAAKGEVAFRDSLCSDIKNKVFSIVIIDKDRIDFIRAIRKACEDDEICGRVFFLDPDFEFGNFSISELEQMLRRYAIDKGADESSLDEIGKAVIHATNGKSLEKAARSSIPELADVGKGENWGRMLMDFALGNPDYSTEHEKSGRRVIINIAELLLGCVSSGFSYSTTRRKYMVNPVDGMLMERNIALLDK